MVRKLIKNKRRKMKRRAFGPIVITTRVPKKVYERVFEIASKRYFSVSHYVRAAIIEKLAKSW